MAAVIVTSTSPRPLRPADPGPARPPLRVIPGGRRATRAYVRARRPLHPAVYRRRRLAVTLGLLTVVVVGYLALTGLRVIVAGPAAGTAPRPAAAVPAAPAGAARSRVYVVQPGDTLWSIARSLRPTGDIRAVVDQLEARAGGTALLAGQRVRIDGLTA